MSHAPGGRDEWSRVAFDSLTHGHDHGRKGSESDRRQALVSLDQAIEGLLAGYLRFGPGQALTGSEAEQARALRSSFWKKATWLTLWVEEQSRFRWTADDLNEVRSERNSLQHGGEWRVPAIELVELAREMTVAAFDLLTGQTVSKEFGPVARVASTPPLPASTGKPLVGQALARAAWDVARSVDPNADGIQLRSLARRVLETGIGIKEPTERTLYDALNHAHDRFERHDGVFYWIEVDARDPNDGISGATLAEVCYAAARLIDPDRRGVSYRFDVIPVLERWQVPIRNVDRGATVNYAMRSSPKFERPRGAKPGVYRWCIDPKDPK